MAQTIQSKRLKGALKQIGIKDYNGRTPSCKAERFVRNIKGEKRFHELGSALATVWKRYNTEEQLAALRSHPDVEVYLETEGLIFVKS
jgi:hypothetical protein